MDVKRTMTEWTKQHKIIEELLTNPKVRDLNTTMDYDYVPIPLDWEENVEVN